MADNSDAWVRLDPEKSLDFSISRDGPVKKVTSARAKLRKNGSQSYLNQVLSSSKKQRIHEKLHKITKQEKLLSPRDLNQSALAPASERVSPLIKIDSRLNLKSIIDENNPLNSVRHSSRLKKEKSESNMRINNLQSKLFPVICKDKKMFSGMANRAVRGLKKKCPRRDGDTTAEEESQRSLRETKDSCNLNTLSSRGGRR